MHSARLIGKRRKRLGDDALAFLHGELGNASYSSRVTSLAFVVIAHPAFEADVAAGAAIEQLAARGVGVDRDVGEAEAHQPPATGGMNTTASSGGERAATSR